MKASKLLSVIAAAALVMSCSSEDQLPMPEAADNAAPSEEVALWSRTRTVDEAAEIAMQAIRMLPQSDSRSAGRTFSKESVKIARSESDSRTGESDTLMYVFNFDDNQGFAVVAANPAVPGLIAVTEMGSYDPDSIPDNPGLAMYMANTAKYLSGASGNRTQTDSLTLKHPTDSLKDETEIIIPDDDPFKHLAQYKTVKDTILNETIVPEFRLMWGQRFPEALFVENNILGCCNTATMIAMAIVGGPEQIQLTNNGQAENTINIKWNVLKLHGQSFDEEYLLMYDFCYMKNNTHDIMATIGQELYKRNNTLYTPLGAEVDPSRMRQTIIDLGLETEDFAPYNSNNILYTLRNNGAIIAGGLSSSKNAYHAFVIDGLKFLYWWSGEYIKEWGKEWTLINDHGVHHSRIVHVNWGWNGNGNGWYVSGFFNPSSPHELDDELMKKEDGNYTDIEIIPIFYKHYNK